MAIDPTELQAQREALKKAMRSGVLSVEHGDKSVRYRSMTELRAALSDLDDEIAEAGGTARRRVFYVGTGRGL
jgi:hypothetical protein